MVKKVSVVTGACVVLLIVAKLLGLFPLQRAQTTPPPIPTTLPTTWTIQFHLAGGSIQYDGVLFKPDMSHGGCKSATGTPNPTNLVVCQHDIVQWQDVIASGQLHDLIVFMSDNFLQDAGNPGNSVATFLGKDGSVTTPPGLVVAPDTDLHEWYVVVIDRQNPGNSAHGDPKIKVGG